MELEGEIVKSTIIVGDFYTPLTVMEDTWYHHKKITIYLIFCHILKIFANIGQIFLSAFFYKFYNLTFVFRSIIHLNLGVWWIICILAYDVLS